ncbi:hypothetical protein Nmel_009114 [Mimus melanotis]
MAGQSELFRKYPRKASILNMPLVTTLFYSCFYHYTEAEGMFSSPANLKKTFKIPDKQYVLTALAARAKLRAWGDVDALLTTKNWLGYTKKKAPIGFHRVVEILQRNNAPVQVLQEYVRLVEDVETRLNLATKYKCHDVVIEVDCCCVKRWDVGLLFLSSFSVLCYVPLLSYAWWGLFIPAAWDDKNGKIPSRSHEPGEWLLEFGV